MPPSFIIRAPQRLSNKVVNGAPRPALQLVKASDSIPDRPQGRGSALHCHKRTGGRSDIILATLLFDACLYPSSLGPLLVKSFVPQTCCTSRRLFIMVALLSQVQPSLH